MVAAANEWGPHEIDPLVKNQRLPIFGGIYPKLLMGNEVLERGHCS